MVKRRQRGARKPKNQGSGSQLAPLHLTSEHQEGLRFAQSGDFARAAQAFSELVARKPRDVMARFQLARVWVGLNQLQRAADECLSLLRQDPNWAQARALCADVLLRQGRIPEAGREMFAAVALDPSNITLHINLGAFCFRMGDHDGALRAFQRAGLLAPGATLPRLIHDPNVPPDLKANIQIAVQGLSRLNERFADDTLDEVRALFPRADLSRLEPALRLCGLPHLEYANARRQPSLIGIPAFEELPWVPREMLPWIADVESLYPAIGDELATLLRDEAEFYPYIDAKAGNSFTGADVSNTRGSVSWSALHLYKNGERVEEVCARCPATASIVSKTDFPRIAHHSPEMFFSRLAPGGHIRPHVGLMMGRLTVHMGLDVPEGAGIRVLDETRGWSPGEVIAFDDSFEHEAWNHGDRARVVLIFEAWHPDLSAAERYGIARLFERRRSWLDRFDDDPLMPEPGTRPTF